MQRNQISEYIVSEMADTLTKQEKALRQRFVAEYLADHYSVGAAIRLLVNQQVVNVWEKHKNEKESISKHLKTIQDKKLLLMFLDTYTEYKQGFDKASLTLLEGFGKDTDTETETNIETETDTEKEYKEAIKENFNFSIDTQN